MTTRQYSRQFAVDTCTHGYVYLDGHRYALSSLRNGLLEMAPESCKFVAVACTEPGRSFRSQLTAHAGHQLSLLFHRGIYCLKLELFILCR